LVLCGSCYSQKSIDLDLNMMTAALYGSIGYSKVKKNMFGIEFRLGFGQYGYKKHKVKRLYNIPSVPTAYSYIGVKLPYGYNSNIEPFSYYKTSNSGIHASFGLSLTTEFNRKQKITNLAIFALYNVVERGAYDIGAFSIFSSKVEKVKDTSFRINHSNFSIGYAFAFEQMVSKKISFCIGIKLPFYFAFHANNYFPEARYNVMSGLEPVITTSIKYQIKR
jgi:hypothetical protein